MNCPFCNGATRVTDSRPDHDQSGVRRRRSCRACGEQFTTFEGITAESVVVHKRGERNAEKFSAPKLRRAIQKAAAGWALSLDEIDRLVQRVTEQIRPTPGLPVTSAHLAELVLQALKEGDRGANVARVRYAMVAIGNRARAGGFAGIREFLRWLESEYDLPVPRTNLSHPRVVVKERGVTESFNQVKLARSIGIASKGRGSDAQVRAFATDAARITTEQLRDQAIVTTHQIASEVMRVLIRRDQVAYIRYASAIKRYRSVEDFWMEATAVVESDG